MLSVTSGATPTSTANVLSALDASLGTPTIGDSNDTVTFANDVIVSGDLTVNGENVIMSVSTMAVEDQFIQLGDGVGTAGADFGIVFGDTDGAGDALIWDGNHNGNDGRLGVTNGLSAASSTTSATANYHLAGVFAGTDTDAETAQADHVGNIRIENSEIYIYV